MTRQEYGILAGIVLLGGLTTLLLPSHWQILPFFLTTCIVLTFVFGVYLTGVFESGEAQLSLPGFHQLETGLRFLGGGTPEKSMSWQTYAQSLLFFNGLSGVFIFILLWLQPFLPLNFLHFGALNPFLIFNIVCGFITNTDWQSYAGETTLSNAMQMVPLTFGMTIGAVSGIAVYIAFIRGLTGRPLGNFYEDIVRAFTYVLLPVLLLGTIFFMMQGVPQTLHQQVVLHSLQSGAVQKVALGPVASLVTLRQFGTNGGGFFNANGAHPFENPNATTNLVAIFLSLAIPMGVLYVFGRWLWDRKQAWMIWGCMMFLLLLAFGVGNVFEQKGNPLWRPLHIQQALTPLQSGGNMEGKEVRFGILPSILYTTTTSSTSTGSVNNMHDSLTPLGGMIPIADMMLNVVFGGVGVGLMGFMLYGMIAVFLTGLMVGRTPEIFGKKLEKPQMILASIIILLHPLLVLVPTAIAVVTPMALSSLNNWGPHGFSEILYAYTSASADNGSAFAGLNANTDWYNLTMGVVILLGRYIPMVALLAIAGSMQQKVRLTPSLATLKTNTFLFASIWLGTILVVGALTFLPAMVLGPILEQLQLRVGRLY